MNSYFKFSCDDIWFGNFGMIIIVFYKIDLIDNIRVFCLDNKLNLSFIVFVFEFLGYDSKKVIILLIIV